VNLDKLIEAESETSGNHIFLVLFEVKLSVDGEPTWVNDELSVATGEDGSIAIDKVKEHAIDPEAYGMPVEGFRLKGLKLLARADL
jgi:hypothetical protein